MWVLRAIAGNDELTFRLPDGDVKTLGRATGADFILDAAMVSRVHCRLTAHLSGELDILDLDSTNGTFVNDVRATEARLVSGDRLRVGRVDLIVLREAPRPPEA